MRKRDITRPKSIDARTQGGRSRGHPSWQRRHEAVLLYIIEHPAAKRAEIAAATGYHVDTLSRIMNSPDFRQRCEAQRAAFRRELSLVTIRRMLSQKCD